MQEIKLQEYKGQWPKVATPQDKLRADFFELLKYAHDEMMRTRYPLQYMSKEPTKSSGGVYKWGVNE